MEMYTWQDIVKLCGCKKSKASNMIRSLNKLLEKQGTPKEVLIAGKVSKKFFHEMMKI